METNKSLSKGFDIPPLLLSQWADMDLSGLCHPDANPPDLEHQKEKKKNRLGGHNGKKNTCMSRSSHNNEMKLMD